MKKLILFVMLTGILNSKNSFAQVIPTYSCDFSIGRDTTFCYQAPLNFPLNGPPMYDAYLWNTGATSQNISVTTSGTYWCKGTLYSGNRVANGDFELGNVNFASAYTYTTGAINPGLYSITTNPFIQNYWAIAMQDHTGGTGPRNMIAFDGTGVSIVWTQTITVKPNTDYIFSAWAANINANNIYSHANLQFEISGNLLGTPHMVGNPGVWGAFSAQWNSGANNFAVITIVDQQASPSGNDFALDDIFFEEICIYTDTIKINAAPIPDVNGGTNQTISCLTNTTSLNGSSTTNNVTYNWSGPSSGIVSGGTSVNPTVNVAGIYTLTVTEPILGCSNTATVSVTNMPTPVAQFTATPDFGLAPLLVNYTNTSTGATGNSWHFGDGNAINNNNTPYNTYTEPGVYTTTLIVTDNNGCSDTAYYTIIVDSEISLVIPNVFSPNGDGSNDLFKIKSKGITEFNCLIYNRWGTKMHEITSAADGWDGKSPNGELSSDGTYYFLINAKDVKGAEMKEKGHVQLIR